jgi:beta-exotoxin I transport system permease protein
MTTNIVRLDLLLRRRGTIGYALGMALYVFVIVALYPTFKDDASLNQFTEGNSTVAALFGATGSLTSPTGWLNANIYSNFLPLVVLLLTIGYGASAIAGQDEDGTLGLVVTLPLSRRRILAQKAVTLIAVAVPTGLVTFLVVLTGRGFDLSLGTGPLLGATAGAVLLGIDFGALALFVGALSASRAVALGVTSAIAAASYLVSSLAPVAHWVRPLRFESLFYWAVGNGQLRTGLTGSAVAVLLGFAAAALAAAVWAFDRQDVR